jgi:hypothetical protein
MAHQLGNLPTNGQKQALAGTAGAPATGNEYITTTDVVRSNAATAVARGLSTNTSGISGSITGGAGTVTIGSVAAPGSLFGHLMGIVAGFITNAGGSPANVTLTFQGSISTQAIVPAGGKVPFCLQGVNTSNNAAAMILTGSSDQTVTVTSTATSFGTGPV